jgi:hypothetical protein
MASTLVEIYVIKMQKIVCVRLVSIMLMVQFSLELNTTKWFRIVLIYGLIYLQSFLASMNIPRAARAWVFGLNGLEISIHYTMFQKIVWHSILLFVDLQKEQSICTRATKDYLMTRGSLTTENQTGLSSTQL